MVSLKKNPYKSPKILMFKNGFFLKIRTSGNTAHDTRQCSKPRSEPSVAKCTALTINVRLFDRWYGRTAQCKVWLHDASNVVSNVGSKRLGQYGANVGANVGGMSCRLHDALNSPISEANIKVCIPTLEASFEAVQKTDSRPITFQHQCWKLAICHLSFAPRQHDVSNASSVQHWKYLTHRVAAALGCMQNIRLFSTTVWPWPPLVAGLPGLPDNTASADAYR